MATHSSILAMIIPWAGEPGKLQFIELYDKESDMTEATEHAHRIFKVVPQSPQSILEHLPPKETSYSLTVTIQSSCPPRPRQLLMSFLSS